MRRVVHAGEEPRPRSEVAHLVRMWGDGRSVEAIVAEMEGLGWEAREVDLCLAKVSGYLPASARAGNMDGGDDG